MNIRYHLSKLIPMPMHTHYHALADDGRPGPEARACDWWQWRGRAFKVRDRLIGWES